MFIGNLFPNSDKTQLRVTPASYIPEGTNAKRIILHKSGKTIPSKSLFKFYCSTF